MRLTSDTIEIHPLYYCHTCHGIAKRLESGKAGVESMLQGHIWSGHVEGDCEICDVSSPLRKGGRPKKANKKRGRPTQESNKGIANAEMLQRVSEHCSPFPSLASFPLLQILLSLISSVYCASALWINQLRHHAEG